MKVRRGRPRFAICVRSEGYKASLELAKIYRVLPDARGQQHGLLRVIDESGEDYLYPEEFFSPIALPRPARKALSRALQAVPNP